MGMAEAGTMDFMSLSACRDTPSRSFLPLPAIQVLISTLKPVRLPETESRRWQPGECEVSQPPNI